MNHKLARQYFRKFVVNPALFLDDQLYQPYQYTEEKADAIVERYRQMERVYLAVMLDDEPIGEVILKNINWEQKYCSMGISLQSDEFKNQGYGTAAEILTLLHAFNQMDMETVFADSILKNTRSRHVMEKVGFSETHQDTSFAYYRCDRNSWRNPDGI